VRRGVLEGFISQSKTFGVLENPEGHMSYPASPEAGFFVLVGIGGKL
jgi:hypothetical protein